MIPVSRPNGPRKRVESRDLGSKRTAVHEAPGSRIAPRLSPGMRPGNVKSTTYKSKSADL